ncbi:MAG: lytic transglycosylase domain-containing protein [Saprospiraceae bacterium]
MNLLKGPIPFLLVMLLTSSIKANTKPTASLPTAFLSESNKTKVSKTAFVKRLERRSFSMDVTYNKDVKKFVKKYISKDRVGTELLLGRQTTFLPIFEKYIEKFQLPRELKNLPIIESALNPNAESQVGAKGLWQFMPATGRLYGLTINDYVDERCDPVKSTIAGLSYLKDLYAKYGDWKLAIASYNCGPGRVDKAIKKAGKSSFGGIKKYLPKETQEYVAKFIATSYVMDNYFFHDLRPIYPEYTLQFVKVVKVHKRTSLKKIAKQTGMSLEIIQKLNPSYRKGIIPPSADGNFIIIPIFGEELSIG